jgi:hypothetical protein
VGAALGVTMIGTVSSEEKAAIAKEHGCTHTIITTRENIAERVREITDGKGVPVVYDSVGKDTLQASLDSLSPRGVLVSNGTSSGPVVIDTMALAAKGSLWLTRPAMVHYATPRSHMLEMAGELFALVAAGKISRRAQADLLAGRRGRCAPRAGVAPDHRRHGAGPLSEQAMTLPTLDAKLGSARQLPVRPPRGLVRLCHDPRPDDGRLHRPPGHRLVVPLPEGRLGPVGQAARCLVSVVSVTVAVGALPVALFADRASRVKSIVVMATMWSLATISCMFTRSYGQLLTARSLGRARARPATARSVRP